MKNKLLSVQQSNLKRTDDHLLQKFQVINLKVKEAPISRGVSRKPIANETVACIIENLHIKQNSLLLVKEKKLKQPPIDTSVSV